MTMPTEPTGQPIEPTEPTTGQAEPNGEPDNGDGDPEALGEPGKRALDSMKSKWQRERDARKALETQIAELQGKQAKPASDDGTPDVEAIRREAESAAVKAANQRILKAEVKAAAAGMLADPTDALTMLNLSDFEVDSDGNVDAEDIADAIKGLLQAKPYLSAQGGRRFQGGADSGARKVTREGGQLTRDDLKGKSPEFIAEALEAGRLSDLGYK